MALEFTPEIIGSARRSIDELGRICIPKKITERRTL